MTRTEVAKLMEWLGNAYPNFKGFPDPKAALTTWEGVLGFYDAKVVYMAARLMLKSASFTRASQTSKTDSRRRRSCSSTKRSRTGRNYHPNRLVSK